MPSGRRLTLFPYAALFRSVAVSQDGGSVCVQDGGGGDGHVHINAAYALNGGGDSSAHNCNSGLDSAGNLISATGSLIKNAAGTTNIFTPIDNDGQIQTQAG